MESVAPSDSTVKGLDLAAHDGGALRDTTAGAERAEGPMGSSLIQQVGNAPPEHRLAFLDPQVVRLKKLKHRVRTSTRLIRETMSRVGARWHTVFLTLTYAKVDDWRPRHIADLLAHIRKWAKRRGFPFRYVWVAEMQKRGAIHYHIVMWLPSGLRLPKPDKQGWWPHGASKTEGVKRNATGYLMKYVSKGVGGEYPDLLKGARIVGYGGLDRKAQDEMHYWCLPRYIRQGVEVGERVRPVVGGGRVSDQGQVFQSEWRVFAFSQFGGKPVTVLSDTYGRTGAARYERDPILWDLVKEADWEKQRAAESRRLAQLEEEAAGWYETRASFVSTRSLCQTV